MKDAADLEISKLRKQLAAEREQWRKKDEDWRNTYRTLVDALEGIAEKRVLVMDDQGETVADALSKVAADALAKVKANALPPIKAEREKVKTLVNALEVLHRKINQGCERSLLNAIINDALANVKE
jgi:phosphoribosylformylglycinamidine (FGAM) synthase PurS component